LLRTVECLCGLLELDQAWDLVLLPFELEEGYPRTWPLVIRAVRVNWEDAKLAALLGTAQKENDK